MPASAATTGRAAASLRATIALSAEVSVSTIHHRQRPNLSMVVRQGYVPLGPDGYEIDLNVIVGGPTEAELARDHILPPASTTPPGSASPPEPGEPMQQDQRRVVRQAARDLRRNPNLKTQGPAEPSHNLST